MPFPRGVRLLIEGIEMIPEPGTGGTAMAKLTKRTVDALAARDKPFISFDTEIKGFGVRVMPSGAKTFCLEYRPHGGGRSVAKKRLTLGRYKAMTVEQARVAALNALARIRLGADPQAEKEGQRAALTVSRLIDEFISGHVGIKCKAKTAEAHKIALERLRAAHGSLKAEALTRSQVAAMHTVMVESPFAANRFLAVVSKLFAWAERRGEVGAGSNPARGIERYPEQGRERFLTGDELARLGDALEAAETVGLPYDIDESKASTKHAPKPENRRRKIDPYAVAAIRLLILTGARLREILDARWEQVDLERGVIFLADSKTGRKPVYLSAAAQSVLASLPRVSGNPHIIAGDREGAPRADLKKPWVAVCRAAGLEGVRLHDLRHSFASVGAGASMGLPVIGKLLGHSQAATTHRYAHLDADPLRRAADTIGATIDAAMRRKGSGGVIPLRAVQK
jgi:integrase